MLNSDNMIAVARELQSFDSKDGMDRVLARFRYWFGKELTKTARMLLELIAAHSVKVPGVSWMKIATMAAHLSKSESSVKRAIKLLKSLGIIQVVNTIRGRGGKGRNLYVIQSPKGLQLLPSESSQSKNEPSKMNHRNKTKKPRYKRLFKNFFNRETIFKTMSDKYVKQIEEASDFDASYTPANVPEEFIKSVKPFINNAQLIFSLWGKVLLATKGMELDHQAALPHYIDCWKQTVAAVKMRRIKKPGTDGIMGYFYATIRDSIGGFVRRMAAIEIPAPFYMS